LTAIRELEPGLGTDLHLAGEKVKGISRRGAQDVLRRAEQLGTALTFLFSAISNLVPRRTFR